MQLAYRVRSLVIETGKTTLAGKSRGQALVYVGIMMFTLFAFAALVTDGGMLWVNRRHMQNAVDAAALAGAQNLPKTPNDAAGARPIACDYAATKNAVRGMTVGCGNQSVSGDVGCTTNTDVDILVCRTFVSNDSVRVTARMNFRPIFGSIVGFKNITIKTQATAVVGGVRSACIAPLWQTVDLLTSGGVWSGSGIVQNKQTIMKFSTDGSSSGNFLALDVGNGGNGFKERLADPTICSGATSPQTTDTVNRQTGNLMGNFSQGMSTRQKAWEAQGNCLNANPNVYLRSDGLLYNGSLQLNSQTCYRLIVIPVITGTFASFNGGSGTASVAGFAVFYISDWCGNGHCPTTPTMNRGELLGYYVTFLAGGDQNYRQFDGYGTKIVALLG